MGVIQDGGGGLWPALQTDARIGPQPVPARRAGCPEGARAEDRSSRRLLIQSLPFCFLLAWFIR